MDGAVTKQPTPRQARPPEVAAAVPAPGAAVLRSPRGTLARPARPPGGAAPAACLFPEAGGVVRAGLDRLKRLAGERAAGGSVAPSARLGQLGVGSWVCTDNWRTSFAGGVGPRQELLMGGCWTRAQVEAPSEGCELDREGNVTTSRC